MNREEYRAKVEAAFARLIELGVIKKMPKRPSYLPVQLQAQDRLVELGIPFEILVPVMEEAGKLIAEELVAQGKLFHFADFETASRITAMELFRRIGVEATSKEVGEAIQKALGDAGQ